MVHFMSNSFARAPSLTETGFACVRNYIKTVVPVKLPIGALEKESLALIVLAAVDSG